VFVMPVRLSVRQHCEHLAVIGYIILYNFVFTYLLTPWSRVLLEKLTVNFAASQEIPRILSPEEASLHG
jgi:hypothetical protein